MASLPNYYLSPEEYLSAERRAEFKSEYVDGVAYAMAGGSERHNLITGNLVTELNIQLRATACKVYPSDLKVRLPNSKRFFYPDQQLESLREYLLVAQGEFVVEHYLRQDEGWFYTKASGLDATLALPALNCRVALNDLYSKVS